jgi:hypothetical protein
LFCPKQHIRQSINKSNRFLEQYCHKKNICHKQLLLWCSQTNITKPSNMQCT